MLQNFSLCQAEVWVSVDSLPGVCHFCLYLLINFKILRCDNLEIFGVRSGLLLLSGVSRGCGGCDLGDNTVPFRNFNGGFFGNEVSRCTISVRKKSRAHSQTKPWSPKLAPCTDGLSSCWAAAASWALSWAWGQLCQWQESTEGIISCLPGVLIWKI